MLSEVYLGLGSNLGDRRGHLDEGVRGIQAVSTGMTLSSLYETTPQGFSDQPRFVNAVCRVWTRLGPFELLERLQGIQSAAGRSRPAFVNGPRTLDIDILVYRGLVLESPRLTIPHPRMAEREFVLAPLAEIAPGLRHPVLRETVWSLLLRLSASGGAGTVMRLPSTRPVR